MTLPISKKKYENGRGLIAIGVFVLLFYFGVNSLTQVSVLLSEIETLQMYENDELEESAIEEELVPVCDSNSNQYNLDRCVILILEERINAQSRIMFWSFLPTAGITLIAVGLYRLKINETK